MTELQGIASSSDGRECGEENETSKVANGTFASSGGDEDSVAHSDAENGSQEKIIFGPLSKEESERLQREANEETTKSEDLRLFLQEMHQHMQQQQQQQQQQLHQVGSTPQMFGSSGIPHHQLQHQTSTRSHVLQQTSTPANAQKRSVGGPEQDNVIDSSPDGGWGWIVVFSSFVCMILVEGICLSYGLLVAPVCPGNSLQAVEMATPLLSRSRLLTATSLGIVWSSKARTIPIRPGTCVGVSEMGEALATQSRVALMAPGGLLVGIYLLLGPLASALSNQFDFRPVAMAGGVIATVGLLAAAFSTNVAMLNATLGGIGGIGFGLIYLPAIATVGHWFKRRRPFAVGLALCGSGVGSIVGGQVFPLLVQWFSWSGTLIVLAAFCMQCLVLIVLFRPLDLHLRIKYYQNLRRQTAREKVGQNTRVSTDQQRRRRRTVKAEASEVAARAKAQAMARAQAAQARAAKKALKAQKAQQRRVIYRGSIMQRIIEEKRRQRTVSIGSLDGMVITRDNELIAAPLVADRPPLLTAASITRISEAVMRKMEARLAGCQESSGGGIGGGGGGETPVRCDSNVSQPSLSRKSSTLVNSSHATGLSRLNLVRESLPHLIQSYVQSQASIAVQNYMVKQHHQLFAQSGVTAASGGASGAATVAAAAGTVNPVIEATAALANSRMRSISNATSICPTAGSNTPQTQKARALSSLLQSRELTVATVEVPSPVPLRRFYVPSSACASECLSLRRTISDASITSSNRGMQVPLEIQQEVAELLDGEVRTEVQHRLRREMMRPQYKKDLFFTGSALQLNHTPVSAIPLGDASNVWATRDQSNWDIGPHLTTTHNPLATPNATISTRGFCPETDSTTTAVAIANTPTIAPIVEPKSSITSATNPLQQQHQTHPNQLQQKVSQTSGGKCAGDTMRVVMDYDDDGEDVISIALPTGKRSCCSSPILTFLEELLAPGLLLSPTFICLLLSNVFTMWGLVIPYFMLPDMVAENNWTPHEAGSLISYTGFANTIGRCIATLYIEKAWSSHYKWADCLRVNVASLFMAAVACGLAPLVGRSYNLLVCVGCLFGLSSAVVVSLKSILVVELFGLDKLTNAFGYMLVLQGVASIAGALIGGHLFDTLASNAPDFIPWVNPNASLVYAAEVCFYFASGSFLLAALFAIPLRCLATREVISATYTTAGPGIVGAGGGVYVDDYFEYGEGGAAGGEDGSAVIGAAASLPPPLPIAEPGTGSTSESAVNLVQSPAPSQLQQPQSPPSSLQPHFDSGIAGYAGEGISPGCVTATVMEGVESALPPPPPQPTIPDPSTILSPAPLPSSLFITSAETETQPQMQAPVDLGSPDVDSTLGGAVVDGKCVVAVDVLSEEDRAEVITTAGVPIGTLPSRSTIQPQSPQAQATSETGLTWSATGGAPIVAAVPAGTAAEVKTSLVAEEPALEPVKEEEEEEEMEEQPRVALSSSMQPPLAAPSSDIDESPSAVKRDTETVAIT